MKSNKKRPIQEVTGVQREYEKTSDKASVHKNSNSQVSKNSAPKSSTSKGGPSCPVDR
jgi:hypothetical protein